MVPGIGCGLVAVGCESWIALEVAPPSLLRRASKILKVRTES